MYIYLRSNYLIALHDDINIALCFFTAHSYSWHAVHVGMGGPAQLHSQAPVGGLLEVYQERNVCISFGEVHRVMFMFRFTFQGTF